MAFAIDCHDREAVAFAIDCHDREAVAWTASPRPLTGADIRTLMDRTLWARFGEATLQAPHAVALGHPAIPDCFGLFVLGRFGCPEYVVRDNS